MGIHDIHITGRFTVVLMADGRYRALVVLDGGGILREGVGSTPAGAINDSLSTGRT